MNLQITKTQLFNNNLNSLPNKKILINTLNAHCYNISQKDKLYAKALLSSDVLIPDGISIVIAKHFLQNIRLRKIAGADLFFYEMNRLNKFGGKCFFLGSSDDILKKIKDKAFVHYPNVNVGTYSPPFVKEFSEAENEKMVVSVNKFEPDVLFIGMTAPKQEKWAFEHFHKLVVGHICSIGAVFDFYAGTVNRAPKWMINLGMEWFFRLIKEPKRMWRRYVLGNFIFISFIIKERFVNR